MALEFLIELERADQGLSAALERLDELAHEVHDAGDRAAGLADRLARLPGEREEAAAAYERASRDVEERREELRRAREEPDADEDAARRAQVRAADLVHSAERRADAARSQQERLAHEADAAEGETGVLASEARDLSERAEADPPAAGTLASLMAWATETRATLVLRRAQAAAQREAVIRQANELGSAVLGEPLVAQSVALVARRVEESQG